jgi:tRNA(Ile)-lysidine synthase
MLDQIPHNSKLILAISGGPDSVYLLDQIFTLQTKLNLTLHIAHLNHNTRGKESDLDQKFVEKLAKKYSIPVTVFKLTKNNSKSSEALLRTKRYKFLEKVRQQLNFDYIVTAHHLDDQIETIIFNFFRGTGPTGLTGMSTSQGFVLRPLLDIPKSTIISYLKEKQISYRQDQSNQNTNFNRNLIRHQILPLVKQININPTASIINLKNIIESEQDFLKIFTIQTFHDLFISSQISLPKWIKLFHNKLALKECKFKTTKIILSLSLTKFKILHPAIQIKLIKTILQPFTPPQKQLTYKNLIEITNILNHSQGGSKKILFNAFTISKKNDKIYLHLMK